MKVHFDCVRGFLIKRFSDRSQSRGGSYLFRKFIFIALFFVLCAGSIFAQGVSTVASARNLTLASVAGSQPSTNHAGGEKVSESTEVVSSDVPDAPVPQNAVPQGSLDAPPAKQTKRILGVIPNFRAVSADEKLPPQTVKDKFVTVTEDSFDYSSIVIPAVLAGYSMETKATPEFHQGAAGYARYFWHAAVDQTSENYLVEFIVPTLTHEDTRYYTLGRGGFVKRASYALTRAVVTRSDSGKEVFNFSEVVGSGAAAGLSSLYYPTRERSFGNTGKEWGLNIGVDALSFAAKEFWPDVNHRLFGGAKPATSPQH